MQREKEKVAAKMREKQAAGRFALCLSSPSLDLEEAAHEDHKC